jgi:hypothetical protein
MFPLFFKLTTLAAFMCSLLCRTHSCDRVISILHSSRQKQSCRSQRRHRKVLCVYKVKIKVGADTKATKKKIKTVEKEEGCSQR